MRRRIKPGYREFIFDNKPGIWATHRGNEGVYRADSPRLSDPPANWLQAEEAKKRAIVERQQAEKLAEEKARQVRILQLLRMEGRGNKEALRLAQGGEMVETEEEKARRQRIAQLEKMADGSGQKEWKRIRAGGSLHESEGEKVARQEVERLRRFAEQMQSQQKLEAEAKQKATKEKQSKVNQLMKSMKGGK